MEAVVIVAALAAVLALIRLSISCTVREEFNRVTTEQHRTSGNRSSYFFAVAV